jgi:prepilin-type N-terminal cleavage/methylation domain-containing protein
MRVFKRPSRRLASFTLIELLTVIAIIAILAGLTIMAGEGAMTEASRSRSKAEIQGMSAGLERFKTDNGTYPMANNFGGPGSYSGADSSQSGGDYALSAAIVYENLSGQTNFTDPPSGRTSYFPFKAGQIASLNSNSYVKDPFGNAYGYYTGDFNNPTASPPNNGAGFFDLWTTGGVPTTGATNKWISNWQQQ